MKPWIGCDLDGTLAEDGPAHKWDGDLTKIGPPVEAMQARIKKLLAQGKKVKILTARVGHTEPQGPIVKAIEDWCLKYLGQKLEVTCKKDFAMTYLYDDRCVQVERNTGKILGEDWED